MIAAVYFVAERLLLRIHNGIAVLIQGIALGLLSNKQLEGLTVLRYSTEASVASYSEPSYVNSGLFTWERETIQRFFPRGGRVLVAAAGAGREMIALAKAGFAVDGFDCCSLLVESGRQELRKQEIDARLDYAPPSAVPTHGGRYDAVLVGFSGYMYIPGRDRRIRFLRDLCGFLDPEAPVMVSFTEGSYGQAARLDGEGRNRDSNAASRRVSRGRRLSQSRISTSLRPAADRFGNERGRTGTRLLFRRHLLRPRRRPGPERCGYAEVRTAPALFGGDQRFEQRDGFRERLARLFVEHQARRHPSRDRAASGRSRPSPAGPRRVPRGISRRA